MQLAKTTIGVAVGMFALAWLSVPDCPAAAPPDDEQRPLNTFDLEGPLDPLVPRSARTEADQDRRTAAMLFAEARIRENHGELLPALKRYERALRYDPQAVEAHRSVIALATRLKRYDEAGRYAAKLTHAEGLDDRYLRQLGAYLVRKNEWRDALRVYKLALESLGERRQSMAGVLLHLETGRLHYVNANYKQAAAAFDQVLAALADPEKYGLNDAVQKAIAGTEGRTYRVFGDSFLKAGALDKAVAAFNKLHEISPDEGYLAYKLARVEADRGNHAQALVHLEKYLQGKHTGEGSAPYALLGELLTALKKNKKELLSRLEKQHQAEPDNVLLGYFLADKYRQAHKGKKAEALYRQLVEKRPAIEGYRGLAEIHRRRGQRKKLLKLLGTVAAKNGSLDALGKLREEIAGDEALMTRLVELSRPKKKRKKTEQAAKPDEGVPLAVALLAVKAKQFDAAAERFNRAIEEKPESKGQIVLTWGLELLMAEQASAAAAVFQRGIDEKALPEDNPALHYYLAGALELQGKTDEALAAARHAASRKDDSPMFASRECWILHHAKRHDESIKAYRALLARFDESTDTAVREAMKDARITLSNLHVLTGDLSAAEEWLEQALDEFPDDIGALNDLGYLWADQGKRLQRSLRMVQRAVDGEPDNVAYQDSLGWAYYRLGRYKEAVQHLEKAAASDRQDGVIHDHLADAYFKAGRREDAILSWRRALEHFDAKADADKIEKAKQKIADAEQAGQKTTP